MTKAEKAVLRAEVLECRERDPDYEFLDRSGSLVWIWMLPRSRCTVTATRLEAIA